MKHNKRKKLNQNPKGGKMKVLLGLIFMITQMSSVYALDIDNKGMMDQVVVTAPRFEGEDIAYSGMMSEVVATAPRYEEDNIVFGYLVKLERNELNDYHYLLLIGNGNYQKRDYLN